MNLHEIPREISRPKIDPEWERAARSFQVGHRNAHPLVFTVRNGEVINMGYRNNNFLSVTGRNRLQRSGLSSPALIRDWARRTYEQPLDWNLVEIIDESYHEVDEWP